VHFEVRILSKFFDPDEDAAVACGGAQLRATICARAPNGRNARGKFLSRSARAQHLPQIDPGLRVQAHIPEAVRGQAAAVATAAERRGGRSDDAKDGAVGKLETLGGGDGMVDRKGFYAR